MKVLCVIYLGCMLLLSVSSSADSDEVQADVVENRSEDVSLLQLLADSKKTQQGASKRVVDLIRDLQTLTEEKDLVPEEPDDGITETKGCEDHEDGDQWGTPAPEHENCYCQGQDRFCYHVDCLSGTKAVRNSDGLWSCPGGFSTGNAVDEENALDLRGAQEAADDLLSAEEEKSLIRGMDDNGLTKKKGCQNHQVGDQWGTPEHDNCICEGSDRACYHVDCLSGSKIVGDSVGPWKCEVDVSTRGITGSALPVKESEKRIAALAAFGVFSGVVGIVNFIWSRVGAAKTTAKLNEIQDQIRALDRKVDELTQSVSDLQLGQQYLQQVILYGRDELRLRNMLDTLARMQVSDGTYTGTQDIAGWADSVLSHGSDGVQQALYNLLDMVNPQSALFGGKSLNKHDDPDVSMPQKVTQVYALIGGGYAVWMAALRIKGRTSEIETKAQEGQQKLKSLEPTLEKYLRYGNCPSGYQLKTRACYKAFSSLKTWTDADAYCRNQGRGGMLAMAKDSDINSFLISLKDAASSSWGFWFGLNDRVNEGSWKWPDGTSLGSYKYWSPIEPNSGGKDWLGRYISNEDCVEFFRTGWGSKWNDADCGKTKYFLCQQTPEGVGV
ncbi:uncharacterized protein LOC118407103 [Branchiostoma floridae]|uniref:Uncharacterized protein LOC118407103 n=2 Tax=Branchiostoma floridae TaxID=7739 RepID=A0A9J7HPN1_BRAFL|nr:uncharacterized protein LOC118407103 [Branchiostoma floridae]